VSHKRERLGDSYSRRFPSVPVVVAKIARGPEIRKTKSDIIVIRPFRT